MLPAAPRDAPSLADVLESCRLSVLGERSRLSLPAVDRAVVLLVDGLGLANLQARSGHARALMAAPQKSLTSGFPSTTATALTSLATGALPGVHGVVGYSALDRRSDRILNQLTAWGPQMDPRVWQPIPTVFERARVDGLDAVAIGPERYRESGFSAAILRGARYESARRIDDRIDTVRAWLRSRDRGIAYVYVPELDAVSHAHGVESSEWIAALETLDGAVRDLAAGLGERDGLIVTADHGVVDVQARDHVLVNEVPGLMDDVRHLAGEPRCLQLHLDIDADVEAVRARWTDAEGHRAWVATRREVLESGWFGAADAPAIERMGDLFVAARKRVAYYDGRTAGASRGMIGQHGSLSPEEIRVPLIRFGAY